MTCKHLYSLDRRPKRFPFPILVVPVYTSTLNSLSNTTPTQVSSMLGWQWALLRDGEDLKRTIPSGG